ncbi:MAG: TonB-dependent receptor plug domain-containing protein [Verrucomicrobia bacterium]|nr:TonB-dependent receptor plug domain-containing protein [Verrucomicrobiota bacterium]MDA1066085.1 TonB-dependent receptor plug domain-containing protein [Verrucomicrobiota bacterium]
MKPTKQCLIRLVPAALLLAGPSLLVAQNEDDKIYDLSPFQVNSSGDVGYAAENTLAGSRLNTSLRDTAAPISVYTAEFISDIGVDTLEDVLKYSLSVTPELSDVDGGFGANQLTAFDARYRVRGLGASQARNFFETRLDQDVFNMERIDESRGPNSILFGIGQPGGVINSSTKRPKYIDFTTLDITVGDASRFRAAIDTNKVLVEDKLALRFNMLYNTNGEAGRPWVDHQDKRAHIALEWRATDSTTVYVEYEYGDVMDNPTLPFGPADGAKLWIESGRPAAGDSGVGVNQGIQNGTLNRVVIVDNSGEGVDMRASVRTDNPFSKVKPTFTKDNRIINDPARSGTVEVPLYAALSGPWQMRGSRDIDIFSATVEQRLGENTFLEFAFTNMQAQRDSFRMGQPSNLQGDPNRNLPNGSANPYFQELYFESILELDERYFEDEWKRVTFSHQQDFDNWLGLHRFAAMWEQQDNLFHRDSFLNVWTGPGPANNPTWNGPFNNNPYNGNNQVLWRHYLTDIDSTKDWRVGYDPERKGVGYTATTTDGRTVTSDWVQNRIGNDTRKTESLMFALQSYFWDNRIVTTYGFRKDDFKSASPAQINNNTNGQRDVLDLTDVSRTEIKPTTRTAGLVFHVNDIVSLAANKATNAAASDFAEREIFGPSGETGGAVPVISGETVDYSINFNLLDGKMYIQSTYFETSSNQESSFLSFGSISPIAAVNTIYDNLVAGNPGATPPIAPFITQSVFDAQDITVDVGTTSAETTGYEFSIVTNITDNWRLTANYSYIDSVLKDIFQEWTGWWEGTTGKSFFKKFDQNFVLPQDGPFEPGVTLGEAISITETAATAVQNRAGGTSSGQRHHKFNLFTKYTFKEGALKDLSIGGGARYRSGATWIQESAILGPQEFNGMTLFDFVAGYNTELFGMPVKLQFNVSNLFDKDDISVARLDDTPRPDGSYEVWRHILTPRRDYRLSAEFRF